MDIGKEKEKITVEPLRSPVPSREDPRPEQPTPAPVPQREREKVPA